MIVYLKEFSVQYKKALNRIYYLFKAFYLTII